MRVGLWHYVGKYCLRLEKYCLHLEEYCLHLEEYCLHLVELSREFKYKPTLNHQLGYAESGVGFAGKCAPVILLNTM